jgi:hypothetical protein
LAHFFARNIAEYVGQGKELIFLAIQLMMTYFF